MARLPRNVLPARGIYHVTARGVDRCAIFLDEDDYSFFIRLFRNVREREFFDVDAYCLMPNHFHAIIEAELERLSRGMHRLIGIYAQRFNERYDRVGHLVQDRFHARVIRDDEHFATACRYVWDNPVRAGLCAEAHQWPWSGRMPRSRRASERRTAPAPTSRSATSRLTTR